MLNKPKFHLFITFILIIAFPTACIARTISFYRDGEIWIADIEGKNERFICEGYNPSISPDGKFIAYTLYTPSDSIDRRISIVNINTRKSVKLKVIPGDNNFGPSWSPNNNSIAFQHFYNANWTIGLVEKDDSNFRILSRKMQNGLYKPTWSKDGKSIICNDLENIYQFNLKGNIIRKISLDILVDVGCDSASKFILSADGNTIIYDAYSHDNHKGFHGPPSAIYFYNLLENTVKKITPQGLCAYLPSWFNNKEIIFEGYKIADSQIDSKTGDIHVNWNIYRMNIYGDNPSVLIVNGMRPTVSVK